MVAARTLITIPPTAKRGDVIEIRALIQHSMETGYRRGADGAILPRDLIRRFRCRYRDAVGEEIVFSAELFAAIAANPLLTFYTTATSSGILTLTWEGDNGFAHSESVAIKVT